MVFSYLLIADERMHLSIELDSEHVIVLVHLLLVNIDLSIAIWIITVLIIAYIALKGLLHSTEKILQPKTVTMNVFQGSGAAVFLVQTNSFSVYISI